jgi:hypothetical protein
VSQALEKRAVDIFLRAKGRDGFLHPLELGESFAVRETQTIIRERSFPTTVQIMQLAAALRDHMSLGRATGTIQIGLNAGGVQFVNFREEKKIKHSP